MVWGQTWEIREQTAKDLTAKAEIKPYIIKSQGAMRCVTFGDKTPKRSQINVFREIAYRHIPEEIKHNLPETIRRKYGRRQKNSLSRITTLTPQTLVS